MTAAPPSRPRSRNDKRRAEKHIKYLLTPALPYIILINSNGHLQETPKMTPKEQIAFLSKQHAEAARYMNNAEETLKRAGKQDNRFYKDEKYVKSACGIAHLGVLIALDAWLELKEVPKPGKKKRKSIGYYTDNIAKIDNKILSVLQAEYEIVHLSGYYDGLRNIKVIEEGFKLAYEIIEKIKPEHPVDVPETRGDRIKRALNKMMIYLAVMFRF
jgi:hypothetical protein